MESLIPTLISGELTTTTLLLLFIISLLTKRFVPWWVYESMEDRLKLYEKEAPELIRDVKELLNTVEQDIEQVEQVEQVDKEKTYKLIRRPHGNNRNKPRKGAKNDSSRNSS